jgi:hypothetical protein
MGDDTWTKIWDWIKKNLVGSVTSTFDSIGSWISGILSIFGDDKTANNVKNTLTNVQNTITNSIDKNAGTFNTAALAKINNNDLYKPLEAKLTGDLGLSSDEAAAIIVKAKEFAVTAVNTFGGGGIPSDNTAGYDAANQFNTDFTAYLSTKAGKGVLDAKIASLPKFAALTPDERATYVQNLAASISAVTSDDAALQTANAKDGLLGMFAYAHNNANAIDASAVNLTLHDASLTDATASLNPQAPTTNNNNTAANNTPANKNGNSANTITPPSVPNLNKSNRFHT